MYVILAVTTLAMVGLVIYHHLVWPLILHRLRPPHADPTPLPDPALPPVTLIMPAYNEAGFIEEKIGNLAALDYPRDKLLVVIACDGCTDDTVGIATRALAKPGNERLQARVDDLRPNRGILGVFNHCVAAVPADRIVALTDVTAVLPPDAIRLAVAHYADPKVGAVGGAYQLGASGYVGETAYWRYQAAVKRGEAALGAPLGLHGAFYTFRREAWEPAPPDTINDDFVMPILMLKRGWQLRYDERIVTIEDEASDPVQDARRRRRIAAGNAQQLARSLWLLHPRHGRIALAFASGKAMRVVMPFFLVAAVLGSLALAPTSGMFFGLAVVELLVGLAAIGGAILGPRSPRLFSVPLYVIVGHLAGLAGVLSYWTGRDIRWGTRPTTVKAAP